MRLICLTALTVLAANAPTPSAREEAAKAFVAALVKEDFAAASKDFDDAVKKALPEDALAKLWKDLLKQVGAFKKEAGVRSETSDKYEVVFVTCEFEKARLDLQVTYSSDGKVSGFFIRPGRTVKDFKPPPYAEPDAYEEKAVTVGAKDWPLPGTLTLPRGDGPFPAVVLVQGSGPHDRDETVGGVKVFRDLAWGLAGQGVAVLRYEKRTKEHAKRITDKVTVREEVVEDALAAVRFLRDHKAIDREKVFVVGHSLGAMMAPTIAADDPKLAGVGILAGPTRPMEDLILEQTEYLLATSDLSKEERKEKFDILREQVAKVKDPKLTADTPAADLPLGVPATYWLSLRECDPVAAAAKTKVPMLILQGERDYQVTMTDFAGWKKATDGRKDVTLKSYAALNHLFVEGKGKGTPAEYAKAGHVAKEVIDDVAAWIKK